MVGMFGRMRILCGVLRGPRVVLYAVGVLSIAWGASVISTNRDLVQHGVRTTGVVVANHVERMRSGPIYYPQVRYAVLCAVRCSSHGRTARATPSALAGPRHAAWTTPITGPSATAISQATTSSLFLG
jgi:hypothetical protein